VIEAASFGVPVIASDIGGLPEVVVNGETGYVVPTTTPWLYAEKIIELWKQPEHLKQLGNNARNLQSLKFSKIGWEKNMLATISKLAPSLVPLEPGQH
jgi:glycosyltransferase involved in cell wall biosynthesis